LPRFRASRSGPRCFEGLDRKAHATVIDEFRNRHRAAAFLVLSAAVADDGVSVLSAVSESLQDRVKAPEILKRLGLRGGGRADFAQGGGGRERCVAELQRKARELLRASWT